MIYVHSWHAAPHTRFAYPPLSPLPRSRRREYPCVNSRDDKDTLEAAVACFGTDLYCYCGLIFVAPASNGSVCRSFTATRILQTSRFMFTRGVRRADESFETVSVDRIYIYLAMGRLRPRDGLISMKDLQVRWVPGSPPNSSRASYQRCGQHRRPVAASQRLRNPEAEPFPPGRKSFSVTDVPWVVRRTIAFRRRFLPHVSRLGALSSQPKVPKMIGILVAQKFVLPFVLPGSTN